MARGAWRARALVASAASAFALIVSVADAGAQTRTASQVERDRRAESARAERLRAQASAARREVQALDARLVEAGRRRAEAEAAAAAAEQRLAELHLQIDRENVRRANARRSFESALIAAAFAERRVEPRVVRVGLFARAAAPGFARDERAARQSVANAEALQAQVQAEQNLLAEAQTAIDAERTELAALSARRRAAQAQFAQDAAAAERRARTLAQEARNLRELAQRAAASSRRRSAPAPAGPSVVPAAWRAPAEGDVARGFGVAANGAPVSQGVSLRTRPGAQVVAPANAEVTYAGPFRSYGNVLILSMDGGYALVLTGLNTIGVRVGETVRAGQPVGEMPLSDTTAPELYVEVRREGEPVNPEAWLRTRNGTAARAVRAG
ncbi:MAG: M23 family metallopeptidase [Hyphomonadaceae bacterium]|nr:M23 family metallopeptidase [Hyphomonadaceae bacterium]